MVCPSAGSPAVRVGRAPIYSPPGVLVSVGSYSVNSDPPL